MANVRSMNGAKPVESHADRPAAKTSLPFRRFRDSVNGHVCIEYFRGLPSGFKQPFVRVIDDDLDPLGRNIGTLLDLYTALESQVDGLRAENDELKIKVAAMEGEARTQRGRMDDLRGKLAERGK